MQPIPSPPLTMAKSKSKFALFLLTLALVAAGSSNSKHGGAFAAADDDDGLPQRQEAMAEAVHAMHSYDPANDGAAETAQRAMGVVNGELALLRPIFSAVSKMPEGSAAEVRAKEEARAAANQLLARHLGQLLPGGSVNVKMEEI
ncbi:hypothetical protein ACQ4PT_072268 [Festuca glaucescens]